MNAKEQSTLTPSFKEIAVTFLQSVATGNIREAFQKFVGPDFSHHNPFFRGDAESLMLAMEENAAQSPHKMFEVKLAIQEGDMVTVYSHIRQNPDDLGAAVVHIFRFKDDKVVVLWDIGQPIPENSPNENGMF
ncbi:nuclear transport factor 2 family protein [Bacillus sp. 1P02SD]|uniref:nuclear transport factor 2 family protein n=1 Tax=Bacillus sp. 1P02SD TaxID=3132264 RepID=UPI0039A09F0B